MADESLRLQVRNQGPPGGFWEWRIVDLAGTEVDSSSRGVGGGLYLTKEGAVGGGLKALAAALIERGDPMEWETVDLHQLMLRHLTQPTHSAW